MAYHIYTTKGIVLSSRPLREADRSYAIFTEELGLVHARARGVRAIQSKLRGALEPFSLSTVSLVRGQEAWRLTGAALIERFNTTRLGADLYKSFARVFALLEKLVAGEESHPELFAMVEGGIVYVCKETNIDPESFEVLTVLRLLYHLGYVSLPEEDHALVSAPLTLDLIDIVRTKKKKLIEIINQSLRSSQLV